MVGVPNGTDTLPNPFAIAVNMGETWIALNILAVFGNVRAR